MYYDKHKKNVKRKVIKLLKIFPFAAGITLMLLKSNLLKSTGFNKFPNGHFD